MKGSCCPPALTLRARVPDKPHDIYVFRWNSDPFERSQETTRLAARSVRQRCSIPRGVGVLVRSLGGEGQGQGRLLLPAGGEIVLLNWRVYTRGPQGCAAGKLSTSFKEQRFIQLPNSSIACAVSKTRLSTPRSELYRKTGS